MRKARTQPVLGRTVARLLASALFAALALHPVAHRVPEPTAPSCCAPRGGGCADEGAAAEQGGRCELCAALQALTLVDAPSPLATEGPDGTKCLAPRPVRASVAPAPWHGRAPPA